jgi:hypothetical protein
MTEAEIKTYRRRLLALQERLGAELSELEGRRCDPSAKKAPARRTRWPAGPNRQRLSAKSSRSPDCVPRPNR